MKSAILTLLAIWFVLPTYAQDECISECQSQKSYCESETNRVYNECKAQAQRDAVACYGFADMEYNQCRIANGCTSGNPTSACAMCLYERQDAYYWCSVEYQAVMYWCNLDRQNDQQFCEEEYYLCTESCGP